MALDRVMTPKANCTGSNSQNRSTCSNQTSDTSAACWVFSTSSRRPSSYCLNAASTVGARCMASASAIASSIASLVPEPIEKCAVALASPSSTMLSLTQRLLRIIGKLRHIERLIRSGCPSRNQSNISEMRGRLGVAQQHHVVLDPALAADHRKIAPHRAVDQKWMPVEEPVEHLGNARSPWRRPAAPCCP